MYAKTVFFPGGILSQQNFLFFQTIQSVKHAFATRAGSGKPAFCVLIFSKPKIKTAEKIMGQCFPVKSKVTCKNSAHLEVRNTGLKIHLGY